MISEGPKPESPQEAIKRRAQLVLSACERYSNGGNRDQGIWFFRGMAVQELDDAVRTGRFAGQGEPIHGSEGDMWAAPAVSRIKSPFVARYGRPDEPGAQWDTVRDAQDTARRYAATRGTILTMLETVGIKDRNREMYYLMIEFDFANSNGISVESEIDRLLENGLYLSELDALTQKFGSKSALAAALQNVFTTGPKGVVIGIHKDVLNDSTSLGIEDDGVRIGLGERRLRLEDIRTIQMLGNDGRLYIDRLKKLIS